MAGSKEIRTKIKSVENTRKITRAMEMVAAAKMRKAQERMRAARPYAEKIRNVAAHLSRANPEYKHAFLAKRDSVKNVGLIVVTSDKGLCGGLITNILREVIQNANANDAFVTIGKKVEIPVTRISKNLIASFLFGTTLPKYDVVYPIAKIIDEQFMSGKVNRVAIISSHFATVFSQKPEVTKLLPITPIEEEVKDKKPKNKFILFEPDLETILPDLLKRYMEMTLYQEILESYLAEQAARLLSMQNATNNAKDIIEDLKLEYNKTRQAKITSEILDIMGASAAMAN